jgi:hypothetical protein
LLDTDEYSVRAKVDLDSQNRSRRIHKPNSVKVMRRYRVHTPSVQLTDVTRAGRVRVFHQLVPKTRYGEPLYVGYRRHRVTGDSVAAATLSQEFKAAIQGVPV